MGKYLDLAERALRGSVTRPRAVEIAPKPNDVSSPDLLEDSPIGQGELWEERAAIMEVEAGLPQEIAEAQAAVLCQSRGAYESLEVGSRCPVCNRHLYVLREGRLRCVRCLRNTPPQEAVPEFDGEGR